jgi:hexosaminidase
MKKTILLGLFIFSELLVFSQKKGKAISIIPEPVNIIRLAGYYKLPDPISISIPNLPELKLTTASILSKFSATGKKVSISKNSNSASIRFVLNKTTDKEIGDEGYRLSVKSSGILVTANKPAGLFYGAQTIWQLLPQEIESSTSVKTVSWQIPMVEITDYPRFAWRGLMFDVARHFFTKKDVEDFIDQMVQYKFNLLHMHLTDDEGWRIEIKSLPRLTSVGAWNVKREGYFGTFSPIPKDEPRHFGGFYTQDDIRALVKYAQDRFVSILPEVDVPGHSMAAIVSYPDLSCTQG